MESEHEYGDKNTPEGWPMRNDIMKPYMYIKDLIFKGGNNQKSH